MGQVREKMKADLMLRRYSERTVKEYLRCAGKYVAYFRRPPAEMGEREIWQYLLDVRKRTSAANHKMHIAAIRFLYGVTLGRPELAARIPWPRVTSRLPDILDRREVERLLNAIPSIKYRAVLMTTYAAGLRISEVCALQVSQSHLGQAKSPLDQLHLGPRKKKTAHAG